ncbi:MAG: alpha/beta hydrolase [Pseudomonadota bacterium]
MSIITRYNVKSFGNGQPILFAHGFGCDQNMWRFVAPAFEGNYQVVLFDYIGAGQSDFSLYNPSRYRYLSSYAEDILTICDGLGLQKTILVGHSVSAIIGILAAIQQPAFFASVVLVAPSPCYINDGKYVGGFEKKDVEDLLHYLDSNYLSWSSMMAPLVIGNPDRPDLESELENSFCRTNPEIAKNFARATFLSDNRDDLKKLQTKALILQCSHDMLAPETVGQYMHSELQNSELVLLKATGHCPQLSAPDETITAIKAFLAT